MNNLANHQTDVERKHRIRRNVILLSLLALSFYIGFIVLNVLRA
jgi:hypothetical protein